MTYAAIILLCAFVLPRFGLNDKILAYFWQGLGIFLLIMVVQHLSESIDFTLSKTDEFFPHVLALADDLSDGILGLIEKIRKGN